MDLLIFLYALTLSVVFTSKGEKHKNDSTLFYVKTSIGGSNSNLNSKDESLSIYGTNVNSSVNIALLSDSHHLGASTKSVYYKNFISYSYGMNYSYLLSFKNKSFIGLHFFLGKGQLGYMKKFSQGYFSNTNYLIQNRLFEDRSYLSVVLLTLNYIDEKYYNFHEFTPSISYEYPIAENGYYLAGEIFYSYKQFSQRDKIEFYDTILLTGNELGFQLGVSRRL